MTRQQKYEAYMLKPLESVDDWKGFCDMLNKKIDQLEEVIKMAKKEAESIVSLAK